jgi:carboxylesterase type B
MPWDCHSPQCRDHEKAWLFQNLSFKMLLLFFFLLAGSLISSCQCNAQVYASISPTASTKNGTYVGTRIPQLSQEIFRGIPFAHAPRFSAPESLTESWGGSRDAIDPGLTCSGFGTNNLLPNLQSGEDCLNLNIVRPIGTKAGAKLPVLVWIYGGGFRQGSINDREFNTSYIVQNSIAIKKPVIVVSINYRLSIFGFVYSVEVQAQGVTNLGLRDQWKALEWIKENIGGFGGDPDNVTIWGESAGAFSIGFLTMAYGGDNSNLFQKAIAVSGTAFGIGVGNPSAAQTSYDNVANATGCYYAIDSLQCMRERESNNLYLVGNVNKANF